MLMPLVVADAVLDVVMASVAVAFPVVAAPDVPVTPARFAKTPLAPIRLAAVAATGAAALLVPIAFVVVTTEAGRLTAPRAVPTPTDVTVVLLVMLADC